MEQLTLFDIEEVDEFKKIKDEWVRTRKALFRELAECKKKISEVSHDHEMMKMNICRGKIAV